MTKKDLITEIVSLAVTYCWRCENGRALTHMDENGTWFHKGTDGKPIECDSSGFHVLKRKVEKEM